MRRAVASRNGYSTIWLAWAAAETGGYDAEELTEFLSLPRSALALESVTLRVGNGQELTYRRR